VTDDLETQTEPPTGAASGDPLQPPSGNGAHTDAADARAEKRRARRTAIEWIVLVVAAIAIALVIKTYAFQAFYIPSRSMVPTLEVGDRVLVNKLSYDLHDVNRGDIVVFESGPNPAWQRAGIDDLVKRVIALPGETVTQCQPDRICVNDKLLEEKYLPPGTVTDLYHGPLDGNGQPAGHVTGCAEDSPIGGCKVPPGQYFVLGDNRGESSDARDHGPIKGSSIVGRVFVRIWPLDRLGFL
jgi:signal peptidase I